MARILMTSFIVVLASAGLATGCGPTSPGAGAEAQGNVVPERVQGLENEAFEALSPPAGYTVRSWVSSGDSLPMVALARRQSNGRIYRVLFLHGWPTETEGATLAALSRTVPNVEALQGVHFVVTCFPGNMFLNMARDAAALRAVENRGDAEEMRRFRVRTGLAPGLTSGFVFHLSRHVPRIDALGETMLTTDGGTPNRFRLNFRAHPNL